MARKKNPSAGSFVGGMAVGLVLGAIGMAIYDASKKAPMSSLGSSSIDPMNSLPTTRQSSPYTPRGIA